MSLKSAVTSPLKRNLNIALLQLKATTDKAANLSKVAHYVDKAITLSTVGKIDIIMLPECFNSPYAVDQFYNYSEVVPNGDSSQFLSKLANKYGIYIIGGSIPELDPGDGNKVFNTSLVFSPDGQLLSKHRKAHLFDINIPNGIKFQELETLSAGNKSTVFNFKEFGNAGLGICYDIRFPELAMIASRAPYNSFAMFYPGAFNTTTGPLHWHLLARSRAIDNQVYTVLCSPARDVEGGGYQAYGHSLVVDPFGHVVVEAGEEEEIVFATLDSSQITKARSAIPLSAQRRFDIYEDFVGNNKAQVNDK